MSDLVLFLWNYLTASHDFKIARQRRERLREIAARRRSHSVRFHAVCIVLQRLTSVALQSPVRRLSGVSSSSKRIE